MHVYRKIVAVLLAAAGAALLGGILGGLANFGLLWLGRGLAGSSSAAFAAFALTLPMALLIFPFVLLLGIPLVLPLRRLVTRHPVAGGLAYASVGAAAARLVGLGLERLLDAQAGALNALPFILYGGMTGFALVWMLYRLRGWFGDAPMPIGGAGGG